MTTANHAERLLETAPARRISRVDLITGLTMFALTFITRLPFTERFLYHWDSINFALSINRFDVSMGQPHVPGYILYVGLARLVNLLIGSPERTLVVIALVGSALAVAGLYVLGKEMFGRTTGLLAALFLAVSPLFWFYGEIALPHALDGFVVILAVWMLYRVKTGDNRMVIPAAIWIALAGGFRPQTQLFLMPLVIYASWRLGRKRGVTVLVLMAVVDLAWLVPLLSLSGGLSRYLEIMGAFTDAFNTTTSIFSGAGMFGLARNLTKLSMYSLYGWGLASIPAAFGLWRTIVRARKIGAKNYLLALTKDARVWFVILWIAPVLAYYILIHMGQQGLVFVFLPALILLSAASLPEEWLNRRGFRLGLAILLGVSASIFLFGPMYPLRNQSLKLLTAQTLEEHDAYYRDRLDAINFSTYSPAHTLILSSEWRFPQYYLPDYQFIPFEVGGRWEIAEGRPTLEGGMLIDPVDLGVTPDSEGFITLLIFDPDVQPYFEPDEREMQPVTGVQGLSVVSLFPGDSIRLSADGIRIEIP